MGIARKFWYLSLIVLVFAVGISYYKNHLYSNAAGDRTTFTNCKVRDENGVTDETIAIHQVDHGIKLVEAETFYGAFYGLGFVHAMDRLWQMDFYRRLATGRLAEIVGPEGVQIDKYIRTFGVPRMIKHQIKHLSVEDRLLFENYAAGVNKMA
jgi:penicillin amidase